MESFLEKLSSLFGWLTYSTVQVSILVCLILVIKAVLRDKLRARWHYCLWLILIARIIIPWAPQSTMSVFNLVPELENKNLEVQRDIKQIIPPATVVTNEVTFEAVPQAMEASSKIEESVKETRPVLLGIRQIAALVWLSGAVVVAVYVLVNSFSLWRIVRSQRPVTKQRILDLFEDCKTQMGIRTIIGVVVTERIKSPALFGFVRPRLLLPEGIIETLNDKQLRHVFSHELAHLKRHDIGFGWLMAACQVIHWFNPLVWFAFYRMRVDRELACDALALSRGRADDSCEYGQTIVELLEKFSQPQRLPSLAGILEDKSQLKRRITMIAKFKKGSYRWSALAAAFLMVFGFVVLTNAQSTTQAENKEPTVLAKEFVGLLVAGRFSKAAENFDATVSLQMSADKLAQTWQATTGQAGLFKQQLGTRAEKFLDSDIVFVTCEFEKGPMDVKIVYNSDKQISGLWFVPTPSDVLAEYKKKTPRAPQERIRPVRVVVGKERLTFGGQELGSWEELPLLLAQIPNRRQRIFEVAITEMNIREGEDWNRIMALLAAWSTEYNFEYLSFIGVHPLGSYGVSESRFGERLHNSVTVDIEHSPNNEPLTTQYAVMAICKDAGIPYQWEKSANLADPQRQRLVEPLRIKNVPLKKALLDVLSQVGLRFDLDDNGLYLYKPTVQKGLRYSRRSVGKKAAAPMVVRTNPEAFANNVSPDLKEITVTFDQPMMNLSWSWVGGGETFPKMMGQPRYDKKKMICTLLVKLEPGKFYWVGINSPQHKDFQTSKGITAVPYVILFATTDKQGNSTAIPENFIEEAKEINSRSLRADTLIKKPQPRSAPARGKRVELSNSDKSSEGRESISGSGHAVMFDAPGDGCVLRSVRIYGSRYGTTRPPKEKFNIWVSNGDFSVIKKFSFPYARFTRGNPKWVILRLKPLEVPSTFVIWAGFNPEKTKGVYVHYDSSASGNSFIGLPGKHRSTFDRGEWMIRAVVQQPAGKGGGGVRGGAEDKDGVLGKWESVDYVQRIKDFKPSERSWLRDLFLKNIEFFKGGRTSTLMMPGWEKGLMLHKNGQTKAKYIIKEIDGTTYLFLPWLSGDVTERGQKPSYYVLKRRE